VVASAAMSNEELYLARELFTHHLRGELVVPVDPGQPRRMKNGRGVWHNATDAHPNAQGAKRLGIKTVDSEGLGRFLYGAADLTVILDPEAHPFLASPEALQLLRVGPTVTMVRRDHPVAGVSSWLLPTASLACNQGTFISSTGATQRFEPAFAPPGETRPLWSVLALLARELNARNLDVDSPAEVFALLTETVVGFKGLVWDELGGSAEASEREREHVG